MNLGILLSRTFVEPDVFATFTKFISEVYKEIQRTHSCLSAVDGTKFEVDCSEEQNSPDEITGRLVLIKTPDSGLMRSVKFIAGHEAVCVSDNALWDDIPSAVSDVMKWFGCMD